MMSTLDATVSMLHELSEADLNKVKMYITRVFVEQTYPYRQLSREELLAELREAKKHAAQGLVSPAHTASSNVRTKYGL